MIPADGVILLVEDHPDQVLLTRRALRKAGLSNPLEVVCTGEQAILHLSNKANPMPALILLDLKVPRIGGLKVLEWLRSRPDLRAANVVIVTCSIDPDDRRRADELGVTSYVCKPIDSEGLLEMMQSVPWPMESPQRP